MFAVVDAANQFLFINKGLVVRHVTLFWTSPGNSRVVPTVLEASLFTLEAFLGAPGLVSFYFEMCLWYFQLPHTFKEFILIYMCVYISLCMRVSHVCKSIQKWAWYPPELELHEAVSHPTRVLGTKSGFYRRVANSLNCWAISVPSHTAFVWGSGDSKA